MTNFYIFMKQLKADIISNLQKIHTLYLKSLQYLMHYKLPTSNPLFNSEQFLQLISKVINSYLISPEKFHQLYLTYLQNVSNIIFSTNTELLGFYNTFNNNEHFDKRFKSDLWKDNIIFNFIKEYYLLYSEYLNEVINQLDLAAEEKRYLSFIINQVLDALSPSNIPFTNPQVISEAIETNFNNIVQGLENFVHDLQKSNYGFLDITTANTSNFKIGENIACTPGKVIMQNDLVQLICYEKQQVGTSSIPLLIVPPCINKYYILDLSPQNSLIKWLNEQNIQVFTISWVNPSYNLNYKTFDNYIHEGIITSCDYIINNFHYNKINLLGYCIGGTMLAIAAAYLNSIKKDIINSVTFLATLLNFENPGELGLFVNKYTIDTIEDYMKNNNGLLNGHNLAYSFNLLKPNEMIWSYVVNNYLLGRSPVPFDLLYWNSDSTNLPAPMHSFFLRNMYINNALTIPNKLKILNQPINLKSLKIPKFFLSTKEDHINPWKSTYQGLSLFGNKSIFCLAGSGHVAGVVNPPQHKKYGYWTNTKPSSSADNWLQNAKQHQGSWWPYWLKWLVNKNRNNTYKSLEYDSISAIEPAPGSYVKVRI